MADEGMSGEPRWLWTAVADAADQRIDCSASFLFGGSTTLLGLRRGMDAARDVWAVAPSSRPCAPPIGS